MSSRSSSAATSSATGKGSCSAGRSSGTSADRRNNLRRARASAATAEAGQTASPRPSCRGRGSSSRSAGSSSSTRGSRKLRSSGAKLRPASAGATADVTSRRRRSSASWGRRQANALPRYHWLPEEPMKRSLPLVAAALFGCAAPGFVSNLDSTPTNDLPNPYRTVAPWGKLPEGHQWGALNGVWVDNDGVSLWVVDRCGANPDVPAGESAFQYDSCAGSDWAPVHKLDAEGNIVRSFGAGLFVFPHKIYQDKEGNVWVVDMRGMNTREKAKYPKAKPRGHTVVKFSPEGKVMMPLGWACIAGDPPAALNEPCAIAVAPN